MGNTMMMPSWPRNYTADTQRLFVMRKIRQLGALIEAYRLIPQTPIDGSEAG
jgi:hypothetical protein